MSESQLPPQSAESVTNELMPVLPGSTAKAAAGKAYNEARRRVHQFVAESRQRQEDDGAEKVAYGRELEDANARAQAAQDEANNLKRVLADQPQQRNIRGHVVALVTQFTGCALVPHVCERRSDETVDVYYDAYGFVYELDRGELRVNHRAHPAVRIIALSYDPAVPIDDANWDMLAGFLLNCLTLDGQDLDPLPRKMPQYLALGEDDEVIPGAVFLAANMTAARIMQDDAGLLARLHGQVRG